jgi:hypothetical protein
MCPVNHEIGSLAWYAPNSCRPSIYVSFSAVIICVETSYVLQLSCDKVLKSKILTHSSTFSGIVTSRGSLVGIATHYGLNDRGVGVQVPVGSRIFSSPRRPDRLWGPPNLLSNGYR